jgi:glycine/D-amino acid oxidase-like deaminating enzyme
MKVRSVPIWQDRFPRTRIPSFPKYRGDCESRVVIVGAGLTGSACAASFALSGIPAIVIERDRVGGGATAGSIGLIREDFDASFQQTASANGLRAARLMWQAMRRSSHEFAAALRRMEIRCDLEPQDLLILASPNTEAARRLKREYQARRDAGLDHSWLTPAAVTRETTIPSGGAIRTRGFTIDPYRACVGLASTAASRGAQIFERTDVRRIRATRKYVDVFTASGRIRAEAVIVATGAPLPDLRALRRHLAPRHGYAVVTEPLPAAVRRQLGQRRSALRDEARHFLRWLKDDRVLVAGADQEVVASRAQDKVLVQRTGQLMYELSTLYPAISGAQPEWSWSYAFDETVDGLPYVGLHRNFPRHLFALGHGRHGAGVAWLAARLLLRQFMAEPAKGDELFSFSRIL